MKAALFVISLGLEGAHARFTGGHWVGTTGDRTRSAATLPLAPCKGGRSSWGENFLRFLLSSSSKHHPIIQSSICQFKVVAHISIKLASLLKKGSRIRQKCHINCVHIYICMKKVLTFLCVCDSEQKASYHHSRGISRNHRRTCTSAPAIISFIEAFPSIPLVTQLGGLRQAHRAPAVVQGRTALTGHSDRPLAAKRFGGT